MNSTPDSSHGLLVGLEIHQQLATKTKLFCRCRRFEEDNPRFEFLRRLRPTQSELGQVDPAALFEFRKGKSIQYHAGLDSSCLVEADEEPPHDLSNEVIKMAVLIALTLNSHVVDELHVMRKIVIDGSNTTGFQRTLVIGVGGGLRVGTKIIPVQTVTLEEDAARIGPGTELVHDYFLDRLGVPLVEISLAPVAGAPREIQEIALSLGRLLRSTKCVARGLGTIRQDLNISYDGGNVVEVKGVQKLDVLEKILKYEENRQRGFLILKDELLKRRLRETAAVGPPVKVTPVFKTTQSTLIRRILTDQGALYAVRLTGFRGLLKLEPYPEVRLGKELSDLVAFYGIGGLIHSDELPAYGISEDEVHAVQQAVAAEPDDAFIILGGDVTNVSEALGALKKRVEEAFKGVPAETRGPTADGKTRYTRPRPGAARMYPETDIPPVPIPQSLVEELKTQLPRPWEDEIRTYMENYGLSEKLASQLYDSEYINLFEEIVAKTRVSPSFVAATLTETLRSLSREGLPVEDMGELALRELFRSVDAGLISKEAVPDTLRTLLSKKAMNIQDAIQRLGLAAISEGQLLEVVVNVVERNDALIRQKGEQAFRVLMGEVMSQVRGRVDGKKVSQVLQEKLSERIARQA